MNELVKFVLIDFEFPENKSEYVHLVINHLKEKLLISDIKKFESKEIEFGIISVYFEFDSGDVKQNWKLKFEFGTYNSSSQLQISILSDDYILKVEEQYLEKLKVEIKNKLKEKCKNIIWLMDKDSELLSIELFPIIYRNENLARQLINEIMNKVYGIKWWEYFVPKDIFGKHKARLAGYKSICPSFRDIDERLMSIDIGDLNTILTLKRYKWIPNLNVEIDKFLNGQIDCKIDKIKDIFMSQSEITIDLWEEFRKYLPDDFIDTFNNFELNRNHIMHNKLIDREAYNVIFNSLAKVEKELKEAIIKVEETVISLEQHEIFERQLQEDQEQEEQEYLDFLKNVMEEESGVSIRTSDEIIHIFNENIYEFYCELQEYFRFRSDIEFTTYEDILEGENGKLFEIIYKIDDSEIEVSYSIDMLDESDGAESNLTIFYKLNDDNYCKHLSYINGKAVFDDYQSCYVPETADEFSNYSLRELQDEMINFIDKYFINNRENVDSSMYSIIKDGGESPVANVPCFQCGEEYICIDESYGKYGQCLNCGEMHEIGICSRCGNYFECEDSDNYPIFCENCKMDIEKE